MRFVSYKSSEQLDSIGTERHIENIEIQDACDGAITLVAQSVNTTQVLFFAGSSPNVLGIQVGYGARGTRHPS